MRKAVLLFMAATVTATACDEFPEDPEFVAGEIAVDIQPVNWPEYVRLEEAATLTVEVRDGQDRVVLDPPLEWTAVEGVASMSGSDRLQRTLTGNGLGWAKISLQVGGETFRATPLQDSLPVVLAGISLARPTQDTTMTSIEDTISLTAAGLTLSGAAVAGANLQWRVAGVGAVEALTSAGDGIQVVARGEGEDTVYVTHAFCQGECEPFILVNVAQVADTVAMTPMQDTLVAEDTVRFAAVGRDARNFDIGSEVFTWVSTNEAVVTVDANGLLTADTVGSAQIIATARSGKADTTDVQVLPSGVMQVQLTDAPADNLETAVLYLGGVYVMDNQATRGRRYILDDKFQVDLLTLTDTVTVLGNRRVPVGTYGNLFLQVDSARLTLRSGLTFADGTTERVLTPPEGQVDSVSAAVNGSATVAEGDSVKIVVDFDADRSFPMSDPDNAGVIAEVAFTPTTRTLKKADAATVAGTLTPTGTAGADSLAFRAVRTDVTGDTLYARTAVDGSYLFRYMIPGNYTVSLPQAPACHLANPATQAVSVTAGQALAGINFSLDAVTVDSVKANPAEATINAIGFQTQAGGTAYDAGVALAGLSFTFTSLDPAIATVDGSGVVTAVATGTARIEVASCGQADTASVLVQQIAAEVIVSPDRAEVEGGQNAQFSAILRDSAGVDIPGASFTWSSSDTNIATVDASGLAKALRSGAADIIATHGPSGVSGSGVISVAISGTQKISLWNTLGCVLTETNEVLCWGQNPNGGVGVPGTGDWQEYHAPTSISLPTTEDYVDVAAGEGHACALTALGDIYCWGSGGDGELGNGLFTQSSSPALVTRPTGITFNSVVAGTYFTCATTTDNDAYCWGRGENGVIGNGSSASVGTPTAVFQSAGVDFVQLAIGGRYNESYVCGVGTSGRGYCWGNNYDGRLGNGSEGQYEVSSPQLVSMPAGVTFTQVVAGDNTTCALGSDSGVYCWGWDNRGTINVQGMWQTYPTPTRAGTETFASIGASGQTVCGIKADGSVLCSGEDYYSQFGDGTVGRMDDVHWSPGATGLLLSSIDGAASTMCGVDTTGDPFCWGWKGWGLTGTGDAAWTSTPAQTSLSQVVDMSKSGSHGCALTSTPELLCWEDLGPFTGYAESQVASPFEISLPAGETFTNVELGQFLVCILTADGDIYCRGEDHGLGRLGDGTFNSSTNAWIKALAPAGITFESLTVGERHACAMGSDGIPYCWGAGDTGQLGNGLFDHQGQPTQVAVPSGFTFATVEAGWDFTCALDTGGVAFCWGANGNGELGNGVMGGTYATPQAVQTVETFAEVSAGGYNACGVTDAGAAYCWGYGQSGELGNNSNTSSSTPVAVAGGHLFENVFVFDQGQTTCAREAAGTVYCWGQNYNGNYGSGTFMTDDVPIQAMGGAAMVSLDGSHQGTCAVDSTGGVWCTGGHEHGDTGIGVYGYEQLPVRVGGSGSVGGDLATAGWGSLRTFGAPADKALTLDSKPILRLNETELRARTASPDRR